MTSKAFISTSLTHPPQGLGNIISWLYLTPPPSLLRRVIEDSVRLLPESSKYANEFAETQESSQQNASKKLSAGAAILLERNLAPLVEVLELDERDLEGLVRKIECI